VRNLAVIFRQFFVALFGATLCIFILIPLCTATLLWFSLGVESIHYLFVTSFCQIIALGLAGFLTALFMSTCVPGRETKTTIIGILIVTLFYVLTMAPYAVTGKSGWKLYLFSEMIMGVLFLVGGAIISSWFIAKMRSSKSRYQTNSK